MAAAGLTDVLVGHLDPPVALGRGGHRLDQAPVLLLYLAPPADLGPRRVQPRGECVPHPLQLGDAKHPRPANRADPPVDPLAGEGGGEQLSQPPLERGDLAAKVLAGATLRAEVDAFRAAEHGIQGVDRPKRRIARLDLQHLLGHEGLPSHGIDVAPILAARLAP